VTRFVLYFVGWLSLVAALLTAADLPGAHVRELWPCAVWLLCFVTAFGLAAILGRMERGTPDKR
jgi:hypothetical protein